MKKTLKILAILCCVTACTSPADKFDLDRNLYSTEHFSPADHFEMLEALPTNNCELEQLRRLVITLSMYSYERHSQTYIVDLSSSGGKIISQAFPKVLGSLDDKVLGRGEYKGIKLKFLSDALREIEFECYN